MLRISVTILLMAAALYTLAQEMPLQEKIIFMREKFKNLENLHLIMDVVLKDRSGTELFNQRGEVWKSKMNYYYTFSGLELLMNERLKVVVNKQEKKIAVSKRKIKEEKELMTMLLPMEKMLDKIHDAAYLGQDAGRWHYTASAPDMGVSKMDLFFAGDHIDEMHYRQGEHQTIVKFSVFDADPVIAKGKFDEKKYVVKKGKEFHLAAQYKEYRFVEK